MAGQSGEANPLTVVPGVGSEVVQVVGPSAASLPQRLRGRVRRCDEELAKLLIVLAPEAAVVELNFRKSLEARAHASIKALAGDLACFAAFCAGRPGLPADEARIVAYVEHCEARRLRPATVSRRLSSLTTAHALLGLASPCGTPVVRDTVRAMRRRNGTRQRQAGPLRLGELDERVAAKGFTLASLLAVCAGSPADLRNASLLSLGYDAGLRVSELVAVQVEHLASQDDGSGILELPRSKTDQEGQGAFAWLSPDTMRRVMAWCEAGSIRSGPLFRRVAVVRTKARAARRQLLISDLAPNALVDRSRMAAQPARHATATYIVGDTGLTPAGVGLIIKRVARAAADQGFVRLFGRDLEAALAQLSTHSLRVGLTQDLFANGADAGSIAQALRWSSVTTALRYGGRLAPSSNAAARMLRGIRR